MRRLPARARFGAIAPEAHIDGTCDGGAMARHRARAGKRPTHRQIWEYDFGVQPKVGIVDITSLAWARPWQSRTQPILDALGLDVSERSYVDVHPPPAAIVIVEPYGRVRESCSWFRSRSNVTVVVDARSRVAETAENRDMDQLDNAEIAAAFGVRSVLEWDGSAESTAKLRALVDDVVARSSTLDARPKTAPRSSITRHFAATRWLNARVDHVWRDRIAARVFVRGAHVSFAEDGRYVDLDDGGSGSHLTLPVDGAVAGDGKRMLARGEGRGRLDLVDVANGARLSSVDAHGFPFALDESGFAAAGYRTAFTWLFVDDATLHVLGSSAHDWPVGHAKKLYGYHDNSPTSLQIAPDFNAYVSTFEFDALLSSALPFRWRIAGPVAFVDASPDDSLRRLFFVPDFAHWSLDDASKASKAIAVVEEDVRSGAPSVVVGPNDELRYAVGLDQETWCLFGKDNAQHVGGPGEGYAIFDASHALVRRGRGRLIGGTATHLAVIDEGRVVVEAFDGSTRDDRGEIDREVERAIAVPQSDNFVLVAAFDENERDRATLRVI